jgi:hypothetical protein
MLIENIQTQSLHLRGSIYHVRSSAVPIALRGLVSIPHLLTLHWGILDAPLGRVVGIVTSLSTLKACITNRSTWRTRSHWGSCWGVLTRLLVIGAWGLWSGMLQLLNGVLERLIVPLKLILPRVTT